MFGTGRVGSAHLFCPGNLGRMRPGAASKLQEQRRSGRRRIEDEFAVKTSPPEAVMERVPPPLTTLLETDLDSYEKLEVLRVMRHAGTPLGRGELASALGLHDGTLDEAIDALARAGFLVAGEALRLGARATDPIFADLMDLYAREQASVLSVLSRAALRRIRERAARALVEHRGWRDDEGE